MSNTTTTTTTIETDPIKAANIALEQLNAAQKLARRELQELRSALSALQEKLGAAEDKSYYALLACENFDFHAVERFGHERWAARDR